LLGSPRYLFLSNSASNSYFITFCDLAHWTMWRRV
jgi:hypothetical protein